MEIFPLLLLPLPISLDVVAPACVVAVTHDGWEFVFDGAAGVTCLLQTPEPFEFKLGGNGADVDADVFGGDDDTGSLVAFENAFGEEGAVLWFFVATGSVGFFGFDAPARYTDDGVANVDDNSFASFAVEFDTDDAPAGGTGDG